MTKALKKLLCKCIFAPQMLLTAHAEAIGRLNSYTQLNVNEYLNKLTADPSAMEALNKILVCAGSNENSLTVMFKTFLNLAAQVGRRSVATSGSSVRSSWRLLTGGFVAGCRERLSRGGSATRSQRISVQLSAAGASWTGVERGRQRTVEKRGAEPWLYAEEPLVIHDSALGGDSKVPFPVLRVR